MSKQLFYIDRLYYFINNKKMSRGSLFENSFSLHRYPQRDCRHNLYINYLACLSVCLFVCLYPINVKTAQPIGPKFF